MPNQFDPPRWLRDLGRFLPLKSQFVLSGNVRDLQAFEASPGVVVPQGFNQTLAATLRSLGYVHVVTYDPLSGFQALASPRTEQHDGTALLTGLGLQPGTNGKAAAGLDLLATTLQRIVDYPQEPIALIVRAHR